MCCYRRRYHRRRKEEEEEEEEEKRVVCVCDFLWAHTQISGTPFPTPKKQFFFFPFCE